MKYKLITLGCKVNSYESEAMGEKIEALGYEYVNEHEPADVVVINTCSVTGIADSKSRQLIRREIKNNSAAIICAVGCYVQMDVEVIQNIEGIAIILGTKNRHKLAEYIKKYQIDRQQIIDVEKNVLKNYEYEHLSVTSYSETTRAYLKIQDGCNNFCTYCIIPYARGPLRSRPMQAVIEEATQLAENGYQEIVLTGIHTAGYGQDFKDYRFGHLLKDLCKIKALKRIRISSIEESEIDDIVISALLECPKIVDHLHIPLQSGCDSTLKRMNRHYTTEQFSRKIEMIRNLFPLISITTDVIVGFPGETDEEFIVTKRFIEQTNFSGLHVFPYSIRKGTPAARMENQIDNSIKKQRVRELIDLSEKLAIDYAKKFENKLVSVLFEEYDPVLHLAKGHTTNYLKVICQNIYQDPTNQIHSVRIVTSGFPHSYGIIIE